MYCEDPSGLSYAVISPNSVLTLLLIRVLGILFAILLRPGGKNCSIRNDFWSTGNCVIVTEVMAGHETEKLCDSAL